MLLASTLRSFAILFDVMNFQTINKLKNIKPTYEYASKYVQIYRSCISRNQKIWSQILTKNRQKFPKSPNQNICNQTLSNFTRFPESGDKAADMERRATQQWAQNLRTRRMDWPQQLLGSMDIRNCEFVTGIKKQRKTINKPENAMVKIFSPRKLTSDWTEQFPTFQYHFVISTFHNGSITFCQCNEMSVYGRGDHGAECQSGLRSESTIFAAVKRNFWLHAMCACTAEMSTGLGLDWIRDIANFVKFRLDPVCKSLQNLGTEPVLNWVNGKEMQCNCEKAAFEQYFGLH